MNLLALPFYASKNQQLQRNACRAYSTQLASPLDRFLPFVVTRPATGQGLDCILVYNADNDALVTTILPSSVSVQIYTDGTNDYYVYFGAAITGLNLGCGRYFIDVKGYVSEVFAARDDISNLLKIEWQNTTDLPGLPYSLGFQQRLYLDAVIGQPDYPYKEEGEKDGNNEFVPLNRSLAKNWVFDTNLVPEFLLDVLQSLTLHDTVSIGGHKAVINIKAKVLVTTTDVCASVAQLDFGEPPVLASHCAPALAWSTVNTSTYTPKPWLCGGATTAAPFWEDTGNFRCVTTAQSYASVVITESLAANNCPTGSISNPVSYTLPAGHYVSPVSQLDADAVARAYFDSTKQAYANANAICGPALTLSAVASRQAGSGVWNATFTRTDTVGALTIAYTVQHDDRTGTITTTAYTATIPAGNTSISVFAAQAISTQCGITVTTINPATYTLI